MLVDLHRRMSVMTFVLLLWTACIQTLTSAQEDCSNLVWCGTLDSNGRQTNTTSTATFVSCCEFAALPSSDSFLTKCDADQNIVQLDIATKTPNLLANISPLWFEPLRSNASVCQLTSAIASLKKVQSMTILGAALPGGIATDRPWWEWIGNMTSLTDLRLDDALYTPNVTSPLYPDIPSTAFSNSSVQYLHLNRNNLGRQWRSWLRNFGHLTSIDLGGGTTPISRLLDQSDLTKTSNVGFPNLPVTDALTPRDVSDEFSTVSRVNSFFTSFAPNLTSITIPFNLSVPVDDSNSITVGNVQMLSIGLFPPFQGSDPTAVYDGFDSLFSNLPGMSQIIRLAVTIYGESESVLVSLSSSLCRKFPTLLELDLRCAEFAPEIGPLTYCGFSASSIPSCLSDALITNLTMRPLVVDDPGTVQWWNQLPGGLQHLDILAVPNPTVVNSSDYPQPFPGFQRYVALKGLSLGVFDGRPLTKGHWRLSEEFLPESNYAVFLRGRFGGRIPRNFAKLKKCNLYDPSNRVPPTHQDWTCNSFTSAECEQCDLTSSAWEFFREYNPQWWIVILLFGLCAGAQHTLGCSTLAAAFAFLSMWTFINVLTSFADALYWHRSAMAGALAAFIIVPILINAFILNRPLKSAICRIYDCKERSHVRRCAYALSYLDIHNLRLLTTSFPPSKTNAQSRHPASTWFERFKKRHKNSTRGDMHQQYQTDARALEAMLPRFSLVKLLLGEIPILIIAAYLMHWIPTTGLLLLLVSQSLVLIHFILSGIQHLRKRGREPKTNAGADQSVDLHPVSEETPAATNTDGQQLTPGSGDPYTYPPTSSKPSQL